MPWRLLPREDDFFGLFERHAALTVDGAQEMRRLVQGGENVHARAARIKELEHETDRITHACVERLHKTFITPFDRDDIHRLITRMDDVMDYIESAAGAVMLYELTDMTVPARELADVLVRSTESVAVAVGGLRTVKRSQGILDACIEINRLENVDLVRTGTERGGLSRRPVTGRPAATRTRRPRRAFGSPRAESSRGA